MDQWEPYKPNGALLRVAEASCCEEFILSSEGGEFFVRRRIDDGSWQEAARGGYYLAVRTWTDLAADHRHSPKLAS